MLEKIKNNILLVLGGLTALLGLLLFWERSRRKSAEAIADNFDVLDKVNSLDKEVQANKGRLESEEDKREDIKKETEDEKNTTTGDADFFNKR